MVRRHATAIRQRTMPGDALIRAVHESASVISVPAVSSKERQPDNIFRKRGAVWEFRFQGKSTLLLQNVDKGAGYINLLLAHPEQETSVFEIACGSAINAISLPANTGVAPEDIEEGFQIGDGAPLTDAGDVADRQAINQYKTRAKELFSEIEEARDAEDHARVEEIEKEIAFLTKAIEEAVVNE